MDIYHKKVYDSRIGNRNYANWLEEHLYVIKNEDKESRFLICNGIGNPIEASTKNYNNLPIDDMQKISIKNTCFQDVLNGKMDCLSVYEKTNLIKSINLYEFLNPDKFYSKEFFDLKKSLNNEFLAKYITIKRDFYPNNKFYNLDNDTLKFFKGQNLYFAIEEFLDINNFKGVVELPNGIKGIGVVFEDNGIDKTFVLTSKEHSNSTSYAIDELDVILEEQKNYGRKLQSFAAKSKIPWESAKAFITGHETKVEIKEKIEDVNLFKKCIIENYNDEYAKELNTGKNRQKEALKQMIEEEFFDKYSLNSKVNLNSYLKLIERTIDNFNNEFLTNLSSVQDKDALKNLTDNIGNHYLLKPDSIQKVFDKAIELNDKDTYKTFYKKIANESLYKDVLTSSYINNSCINYIFKQKLSIDPYKTCELGKTFGFINNSKYNKDEKQALKECAIKVLDCPEYYLNGEPKGFNYRTLKVINRSIEEDLDIDTIKNITNRMVSENKNVYSIYKEETKRNLLQL